MEKKWEKNIGARREKRKIDVVVEFLLSVVSDNWACPLSPGDIQ